MKLELMNNRRTGFSRERADLPMRDPKPHERGIERDRPRPPHPPHAPVPPHHRKRLYLEFEEEDWEIFVRVFGDEDSADAAMQVIQDAPPEIGVLAVQMVEMIRRAEKC